MARFRFMAVAASFAVMLFSTGCDLVEFFLDSEELNEIPSDHADSRFDTEPVKKLAGEMQNTWRESGQEETIKEQITTLIDAVDQASAVYLRAEMAYYADWNNKDLETLHNQTQEDYYVVYEAAAWAISNGYRRSQYPELFQPYIYSEKWTDYYVANTLSKVTSKARSQSADSDRRLDEYYTTAYSEDADPVESNAVCAQLYLDTLAEYNTDKFLYDYYRRDYSVEDTTRVYHEIVEKLVPLQQKLTAELQQAADELVQTERRYTIDEPFEVIKQFATQISPRVTESVERLLDKKLYVISEGENSYDTSYTVMLPYERNALIYTHRNGGYFDFVSAVHEFGHFHADWRDGTPIFLQTNCLDIAEIHSQAFEMLFTAFYHDIFGQDAAFLEKMEIYNLLDSIIAGFAVGEFEYEVMKQLDSITAEQVLEIYSRIQAECNLNMEMYQINHLYEQPGYYVSYGVSALAALQIYTQMQTDGFDSAAALYEKIAQISAVSGEYEFGSALSKAGFKNIFSADYVDQTAKTLQDHIQQLG